MNTTYRGILISAVVALFFCISAPVAADNDQKTLQKTPEQKSESTQAVQKDVESKRGEKIAEHRKKIFEEAAAAVAESRKALNSLDKENIDEALQSLELAIGKMEVIVARDPKLALAPVDMSIKVYDLYAHPETIKAIVKAAEDFLEDGEVQKARPLIAGLASEMVIESINIPLATYPDTIKEIIPLIDKGEIEEAKKALQTGLNTLVVIKEEVIPLPTIRATAMLEDAEKLAETESRNEEDNKKLTTLINDTQNQLELAEVLGYGNKEAFKPMHEQLNTIREKTKDSKHGKGFFDKLKNQLSALFE